MQRWLLYASLETHSNNFIVKFYNPIHRCYMTNKNRQCNANYVAKMYENKIISQSNIKLWEL